MVTVYEIRRQSIVVLGRVINMYMCQEVALIHCMMGYKMAALKSCLQHLKNAHFWQDVFIKVQCSRINRQEPRSRLTYVESELGSSLFAIS